MSLWFSLQDCSRAERKPPLSWSPQVGISFWNTFFLFVPRPTLDLQVEEKTNLWKFRLRIIIFLLSVMNTEYSGNPPLQLLTLTVRPGGPSGEHLRRSSAFISYANSLSQSHLIRYEITSCLAYLYWDLSIDTESPIDKSILRGPWRFAWSLSAPCQRPLISPGWMCSFPSHSIESNRLLFKNGRPSRKDENEELFK